MLQSVAKIVSGTLGRQSWLIRSTRPAYESLLDLIYRKGLPWVINGVEYRIDPRQRRRLGNEYEQAAAEFLRMRVRDGHVCFDVGANAGAYVLQLAYWSRPSGRVVAFEPNPEAQKVLEHHVKLNGDGGSCYQRVRSRGQHVGKGQAPCGGGGWHEPP